LELIFGRVIGGKFLEEVFTWKSQNTLQTVAIGSIKLYQLFTGLSKLPKPSVNINFCGNFVASDKI